MAHVTCVCFLSLAKTFFGSNAPTRVSVQIEVKCTKAKITENGLQEHHQGQTGSDLKWRRLRASPRATRSHRNGAWGVPGGLWGRFRPNRGNCG